MRTTQFSGPEQAGDDYRDANTTLFQRRRELQEELDGVQDPEDFAMRRRVRMLFTNGFTDGEINIVSYRCTRCKAEFRTFNGGPLITRDAFDNGVRQPMPQARVIDKEKRR